jgi:ABC-type transport system involved in multi-copper enzyme maturation permease subunit
MRERSASTERQGNVARTVALVLGLSYVAAGLIGFTVTGFTGPVVLNTPDRFLGFFDLNIFHNIVHVAIGGGLIVASRMRDLSITQGTLIGVGLFYALAALLGFLNYLQLISINTSLSFDNFFHLLTAAVAIIFGLIGIRQEGESVPARAGVASAGPLPIEERRAQWDKDAEYREKTY